MKDLFVQALRFGLVGVANTAVGLTVIFGAMSLLEMPPLWANLAGYIVGLTVSFVLNARWTFRSRVVPTRAARFMAAFGVSYVLNVAVLTSAVHGGINVYLSQILAAVSYSLAFFVLSKFFVFRSIGSSRPNSLPPGRSLSEQIND